MGVRARVRARLRPYVRARARARARDSVNRIANYNWIHTHVCIYVTCARTRVAMYTFDIVWQGNTSACSYQRRAVSLK